MPREIPERFALLMQIHLLTHPNRVAARYGVTGEYVRRQFRHARCPDMDALRNRLDMFLGTLDSQHRQPPATVD